MSNNSLVIKNLSKIYKNNILANDNISLEFKTHTITALIGHNGAGKTTLLNQIAGLAVPTYGKIEINGIDAVKEYLMIRKLVSSMPQFQVPIKGVTVLQAIKSISMIKGFSGKVSKEKAENIIKYLQIDEWKNTPGEKLSGGLQRLTSFAMSVIDEAPVIILDEPTNDVDPIRRVLIWKYLRKLADNGCTIIIVTHNLLEVEKYADRYILLDKGCVKRDVKICGEYTKNIKHILCIYDIDNQDIILFPDYFNARYNIEEKKLIIFLEERDILTAIEILIKVLNDNKATSYEMKIESLFENYENIIYEKTN